MKGQTFGDQRWQVDADSGGVRLDRFLADASRVGSRARAVVALQRGKVFVNDEEVSAADAGRRLAAGDRVRLWMDRPGSAHRRAISGAAAHALRIVYEDDTLIVVNKPAGLLTVPLPQSDAQSVYKHLSVHLRSRGKIRPLVVHRIDRDTSGLVLFATRAAAQARLKDQFKRREAERIYLAVVHGRPAPASGVWRDHLVWDRRALVQKPSPPTDAQAKEARCEYRVVENFPGASLLEIRLITGRRNQIRIQARLRGHTLVGERRYIDALADPPAVDFARQALHAYRLGFRHPVTGRVLRFEAPIPADLAELLSRLRKS